MALGAGSTPAAPPMSKMFYCRRHDLSYCERHCRCLAPECQLVDVTGDMRFAWCSVCAGILAPSAETFPARTFVCIGSAYRCTTCTDIVEYQHIREHVCEDHPRADADGSERADDKDDGVLDAIMRDRAPRKDRTSPGGEPGTGTSRTDDTCAGDGSDVDGS